MYRAYPIEDRIMWYISYKNTALKEYAVDPCKFTFYVKTATFYKENMTSYVNTETFYSTRKVDVALI